MSDSTAAPKALTPTTTTLLGVLGVVAAVGPLVLLLIAAFAGPGPRSSVMLFGIPVLLCTVIAILLSIVLIRGGQRRWGLTVGWIALAVGLVSYVVWGYIAALGVQFGNGPL